MSQPEPGAGEGLLVTRILLYLPTYKMALFEKVLTAKAPSRPHHHQCRPSGRAEISPYWWMQIG